MLSNTQPITEAHDPYAALRHRDYSCLLLGTVLASIGSEMQAVAVGWQLWERTGSAANLGLVGLVQFLPVLFLSLPAGHAVDRYNRKALLIIALLATSIASLGLTALAIVDGPVLLIYFCILLVGLAQAFGTPARWSLVPQTVPEQDLPNAVTWNSSAWQIASVLGPALGGGIISLTGSVAPAYVGAACGSLLCAGLVVFVRPRPFAGRVEGLSLATLVAGIRFVWQNKVILATITLDLFAVLLGGAVALLPIYATSILHVGATGLGWLRAAPSIGALTMALVLAHRPPLRRAGRTLLWAVAGFGIATIVFGLSGNVVLSFVMLALTGALDNISVVVRGTLVQVLTPDVMRGRVSAINAIFIVSSNELGAFESGITAQFFGPIVSVVGGGIGTIIVVATVALLWPQVLALGSLQNLSEPSSEDKAAVPPS